MVIKAILTKNLNTSPNAIVCTLVTGAANKYISLSKSLLSEPEQVVFDNFVSLMSGKQIVFFIKDMPQLTDLSGIWIPNVKYDDLNDLDKLIYDAFINLIETKLPQ